MNQITSKLPKRQLVDAGALVLIILGSSIVSSLFSYWRVNLEQDTALQKQNESQPIRDGKIT